MAIILAVLLCSLTLFTTGVVLQGYDLNWDVLNYHFCNDWAVLHHTVWTNVQPAMRQGLHNKADFAISDARAGNTNAYAVRQALT